MKKYGRGEVIPEKDDQQKTAANRNWSDKDEAELREESSEDGNAK